MDTFQEAVGGYIETVTLATDLVLIVNEEGRLLDLPYNTTVCGLPIYGTVVAVGTKRDEFASLKASVVPYVLKMLNGEK